MKISEKGSKRNKKYRLFTALTFIIVLFFIFPQLTPTRCICSQGTRFKVKGNFLFMDQDMKP